MNQISNQKKAAYNTPQFERYGNVRDLTQAVVSTNSVHLDAHAQTRTH